MTNDCRKFCNLIVSCKTLSFLSCLASRWYTIKRKAGKYDELCICCIYKWYTEYYVCYFSEIIYILEWTPYPTYDLKLCWFTHILNHFGLVKTCINVTWLDVEDIWLEQYKTSRANYLRVMFWHFTLWLTTREENCVSLCVHLIIHKSYLY